MTFKESTKIYVAVSCIGWKTTALGTLYRRYTHTPRRTARCGAADVIAGAGLVFEVRGTDYPRRNLSRVPAGRSKVAEWAEDHRADTHIRDGTARGAFVYIIAAFSLMTSSFLNAVVLVEWKWQENPCHQYAFLCALLLRANDIVGEGRIMYWYFTCVINLAR